MVSAMQSRTSIQYLEARVRAAEMKRVPLPRASTYQRRVLLEGLTLRNGSSPDSASRGPAFRVGESMIGPHSGRTGKERAHSFPLKWPESMSNPEILPSAPSLMIVLHGHLGQFKKSRRGERRCATDQS